MRVTRAAVAFLIAASAAVVPAVVPGSADASPAPRASGHSWLPPTPANWPLVTGEQSTPAQTITAGAQVHTETYQTVSGAQDTRVLDVDLSNPNIAVRAVEAGDEVIDPADETVTSMGTRTGAVAGINAGFFDINATGQPTGGAVVNGQILKSPSPTSDANLVVLPDGSMTISQETFSGTITSGSATNPLHSINNLADGAAGNITEITPAIAATAQPLSKAGTLVTATTSGPSANQTLTVTAVAASASTAAVPAAGTVELYGAGAGATWLTANAAVGDTLTVTDGLSPDAGLTQLVSGSAILVKDGVANTDTTGGPAGGVNPETAVGLSKDGKHAIFVTLDGLESENKAVGVNAAELTGYLLAHGVYNAVELDGGGSTEMAARLPGSSGLSVLNTPSDGHERHVANGLFLYSTEAAPAPARTVTVNTASAMSVLPGSSEPLPAYATDAAGNPASSPVSVTVEPAKLATVSGSGASGANLTLTAGAKPGRGWLVAHAGRATSREPLDVTAAPASLSLSPTQPDLDNAATQQFTLTGSAAGGGALAIGAADATWSVSPADLGTISADGLFTAAASGGGLATVTATAGGVSATASVAVGSDTELVDPMTDVSAFGIIDQFMDVYPRNAPSPGASSISDGSISASTMARLPGESGSIDMHYDFKPGAVVYHTNLYPNDLSHDVIGPNAAGQSPTAYSFWIKSVPAFPGALPSPAAFYVTSGYYDSANAPLDFNIQPQVTEDWQQITVPLPAGTRFPIELNYINMVNIDPTVEYTGDLYIADLQADYSPRPPSTPTYTAIPDNPSWLQYVHTPSQFGPGGATIADFDDSHLVADDPNSTGTVVTQQINSELKALSPNAAPNMLQVNGDLTDTGSVADLQYGYDTLASFGLPFHDAVGNHEISQGTNPQNTNWTQLFGPTHYSYTDGAANFIVTDSASGGLTASDPFQVPAEEQYAWLSAQLDANRSKVVFLVTHMPPYDPHPVNNSHFSDPYEAEQFEQLAENYQASHPQVHVILLFGHARGVAEQLLNPAGQPDPHGLPNFVVADAGSSAAGYTPVDQGGFYNYALFHVLPNGDVQFSIQPVLASIAVTAPSASLAVHATEQLTATGTSPTGDDLTAIQVPIADPASHLWTSSNKRVASVNPSTGVITALRPGTATISVTSGGITAATTITVTAP